MVRTALTAAYIRAVRAAVPESNGRGARVALAGGSGDLEAALELEPLDALACIGAAAHEVAAAMSEIASSRIAANGRIQLACGAYVTDWGARQLPDNLRV